jgi:hypothetical protein
MNVGELLKERDRLLGVIDEAKTARAKLKQINTLIAMYGDERNVSNDAAVPSSNITHLPSRRRAEKSAYEKEVRRAKGIKPRNAMVKCPKCERECLGPQGLAAHMRSHIKKTKAS